MPILAKKQSVIGEAEPVLVQNRYEYELCRNPLNE